MRRNIAKLCTSRLTQTAVFLWVQNPVAENFIIPDGILVLAAGVAGVALDGVDDAVFAFFHNADVIGFAVLRAGCAVWVIPVKENDHGCDALRYAVMTAWRYLKTWLPAEIEEKEYIVDIARKEVEKDGYI